MSLKDQADVFFFRSPLQMLKKLLGATSNASPYGKGSPQQRALVSTSFHHPRFIKLMFPWMFIDFLGSKSSITIHNHPWCQWFPVSECTLGLGPSGTNVTTGGKPPIFNRKRLRERLRERMKDISDVDQRLCARHLRSPECSLEAFRRSVVSRHLGFAPSAKPSRLVKPPKMLGIWCKSWLEIERWKF